MNSNFEIDERDVRTVLARNGVHDLSSEETTAMVFDIDLDKIKEVVDKQSSDAAKEKAALDALELELARIYEPIGVECSLCGNPCLIRTAHYHQNDWIGDECCWDERLRASE